jgi:hypothetical protein
MSFNDHALLSGAGRSSTGAAFASNSRGDLDFFAGNGVADNGAFASTHQAANTLDFFGNFASQQQPNQRAAGMQIDPFGAQSQAPAGWVSFGEAMPMSGAGFDDRVNGNAAGNASGLQGLISGGDPFASVSAHTSNLASFTQASTRSDFGNGTPTNTPMGTFASSSFGGTNAGYGFGQAAERAGGFSDPFAELVAQDLMSQTQRAGTPPPSYPCPLPLGQSSGAGVGGGGAINPFDDD